MSKVKEIETLLKTDVLVEVDNEIQALEKLLQKGKNKDLQIELEYYKDIKKFYNEALSLIKANQLSEKEANNLLLDLEDMRIDEDEL